MSMIRVERGRREGCIGVVVKHSSDVETLFDVNYAQYVVFLWRSFLVAVQSESRTKSVLHV